MFIQLYPNCLSTVLCDRIINNDIINKTKLLTLLNKELSINLKTYLTSISVLKMNFMEFDNIDFKVVTNHSPEFINEEFVDFYNTRFRSFGFIFCFNSPNGFIEFINGEKIVLLKGSLLIYPINWSYSYKFCFDNASIAHGFLYTNTNKLVQNKVNTLLKNPSVLAEELHTCL